MSLQQILDQETFKSRRSLPLTRPYTLSHPIVYPLRYNKRVKFERFNNDLPYRILFSQVGHLETVILTQQEVDYAADYDPFSDDYQVGPISGFIWKYYGWADIGERIVCGNGSVYIPRRVFDDITDEGEFLPRGLF